MSRKDKEKPSGNFLFTGVPERWFRRLESVKGRADPSPGDTGVLVF
jgi:hypothetical protein